MTEKLYLAESYLREARAKVVAYGPEGVVLDRTIFYAQGGGQLGDRGELRRADGARLGVANVVYSADKSTIFHVLADQAPSLQIGEELTLHLDWDLRFKRMRAHSALHLLTAVLPYPVTGGSVGDAEGRLDFDSGDAVLDKADIEQRLAALIARNAAISMRWIADAELEANPSLVKTMSVKPPMGTGRVRLVEIAGTDLQPCGGTHVANTEEIGAVRVTQIEKKGKINRRVRIVLDALAP